MRPRFALAVAVLLGLSAAAPAAAVLATDTTGTQYESARVVVPMTFPIAGGTTSLSDTYLTCRSGCARKHMGQDLMGAKMTPIVATFDGVVSSLRRETSPGAGNYIAISADRGPAAGWTSLYLHVNNDTPGTDDGRGTAAWAFPAGLAEGSRVLAGQLIGWRGDSGNAENTGAHIHFELRKGWGWSGVVHNAYPSLVAARRLAAPTASGPHPEGTLVRHPNGTLFVLEAGAKRLISPTVLAANALSPAAAIPMTAAESMGYGSQPPVVLRDGTIARDGAGGLWLVTAGQRVAVTDAQLAALGRATPRIWPATDADLAGIPVSQVVPESPIYPGALVRTDGTTEVRYVDRDGRQRYVDEAVMASHGWTVADVAVVPATQPELPVEPAAHIDPNAQQPVTDEDLAEALPLRDGVLVQTPSRLVGVVSGGKFRRIWDSRMVAAYGYTGKPRLLVPTAVITALPTAELTQFGATSSSWRR